ncbi:unnamed protein product, partial [Ectocarpus sp. 6 AP-2014]
PTHEENPYDHHGNASHPSHSTHIKHFNIKAKVRLKSIPGAQQPHNYTQSRTGPCAFVISLPSGGRTKNHARAAAVDGAMQLRSGATKKAKPSRRPKSEA